MRVFEDSKNKCTEFGMHFHHNTYIFIDAVEEVVSPGGIAGYHNRKKEMTFDKKVYMYQVT